MVFLLDQTQTFLASLVVFFLGSLIHARFYGLRKFNIPEPVIGGILVALVFTFVRHQFEIQIVRDMGVQNQLMYAFFATVGLSARFSLFKNGGKAIFTFLSVAVFYLVIQNLIGVSVASMVGLDPRFGLLAGSITLSGGHATGASYAAQFHHLEGAVEIALACATFGLVLGGIIGGPVSQWLIARNDLAPSDKVNDPDECLKGHGFNEPELVTTWSTFQVLFLCLLAMVSGDLLSKFVHFERILVPEFIWILFSAIFWTNIAALHPKTQLQDQSIELVNMISLSLFLSLAMMGLDLMELVNLALPVLAIVIVQVVALVIFTTQVTFRLLGKDYDAAVIVSGHCGFGLGATPTALANMESITNRYGAAPSAIFVVLMVGAFFIDIANALVIQGFLGWVG
ncbi:MAG: sodium/glutamate symporter [Zetaproteobacteria bacterium]|nr:sodium/glutamate symporter [Zetaproteobacteria bacterium]